MHLSWGQSRRFGRSLRCFAIVIAVVDMILLIVAYTKQHYFYTDGTGEIFDCFPQASVSRSFAEIAQSTTEPRQLTVL